MAPGVPPAVEQRPGRQLPADPAQGARPRRPLRRLPFAEGIAV